jgi:Fic family protein
MKATGTYVKCSTASEAFQAFVPAPLPPEPPLALNEGDQDLMEQANRALGRLDGLTTLLPDSSVFLYGYVRKEALLSSQIEGTQSSFADLVLHESHLAPGVPIDDVQEVSNYVAAMSYGLRRIRKDGFPLSLRLIKEIHAVLMAKGRGSHQAPGEFRRSQNWIGGTRPGNAVYVPPPWEQVIDCMGNLEKFLHDQPRRTPVLVKAALAHVQFETIHPFLDGNGRLGRLLITLILCAEGALQEPLLYLSLYFKQHRQTYYELLQEVRLQGQWLRWLRFFLEGIRDTAQQAVDTAKAILALFDKSVASFRANLASRSDAELMVPWTFKAGGKVMFTLPRVAVLRSMVFSHLVHHRGQLTVYLRLQNVPLPAIYGPSADEGAM